MTDEVAVTPAAPAISFGYMYPPSPLLPSPPAVASAPPTRSIHTSRATTAPPVRPPTAGTSSRPRSFPPTPIAHRPLIIRSALPSPAVRALTPTLDPTLATSRSRQGNSRIPFSAVEHLPGLRLSPLGVIPQRDRRPRTIVDYTYSDVNNDSAPVAPSEAMQFGRALQRLIAAIYNADPRHGPVAMSKIDIADGFYRLWLAADDIPRLGVAYPPLEGYPPLVAFPLVLPMGWINSPPYFCAATETVADIANTAFRTIGTQPPPAPHRLEAIAATLPATDAAPAPATPVHDLPDNDPLAYTDVYVDDFITLAQGGPEQRLHVLRLLLGALDSVFRPVDPADRAARQEPASVKKLLKGDGAWTTRKTVLGWLVDTVAHTVALPDHRVARLHEILASFKPRQARVSTKTWHKVLGELRSMTLAVPGSRGLFSTLQAAFRHPLDHGRRLRLSRSVHAFLDDFRWLAADLSTRPTHMAELVPQPATVTGCTDASGIGMGGIFFHPHPVLWRSRFPSAVVSRLVTSANRSGTITNSDLELAASIVQHDVIAATHTIHRRTIHNLHDNSAAVCWQRKGSATTTGPAAYLLRLQALHQRSFAYLPLHDHVPGPVNAMADDCRLLDAAPGSAGDSFRRDLGLVAATMRAGVVPGRATAADRHWALWCTFCAEFDLDPWLHELADPVPVLQVFGARYRDGRLAPSHRPVRHRTVEDAVRSVGQTLARVGAPDPRLDSNGNIDFRLQRQLRAYSRLDPPPDRVKPIPRRLLLAAAAFAASVPDNPGANAISDMICIAFFFLLRPGEYTGTTNSESCPFRLADIQLFVGSMRLRPLLTAPDADLRAATHVSYTFTNQKSGVRGEIVHHGRSGASTACPVLATVRRVLHLRRHKVPVTTPLASYVTATNQLLPVTASDITNALRAACTAVGPSLGLLPSDISARSLRAGGAMALLCAKVDPDLIRLLGRWHSEAMMRYLHLQATPLMQNFAKRMFDASDYALHPGPHIPFPHELPDPPRHPLRRP